MHMNEKSENEIKIRLFDNATIFIKVTCGILLLCLIMHIVALSTSYWMVAYVKDTVWWHEGLWQSCYQNIITEEWACGSYEALHHTGDLPDWFHATQGLAILALISLVPANFLTVLFAMLPKLSGRKFCSILSIATCIASGVLLLLVITVYGASYPQNNTEQISAMIDYSQNFHFCFAFEILTLIGCVASTILLILDYRTSIIL